MCDIPCPCSCTCASYMSSYITTVYTLYTASVCRLCWCVLLYVAGHLPKVLMVTKRSGCGHAITLAIFLLAVALTPLVHRACSITRKGFALSP